MSCELVSVAHCADLCGLGPEETVLGVTPSAMHASLYDSYLLRRRGGSEAIREMIVADLRAALDLGAKKRAADLLIVLRRLLSERMAGVVTMRLRPDMARAGEPRRARTQIGGGDRLCVARREPGRLRSAAALDNVFFLDAARMGRQIALRREH